MTRPLDGIRVIDMSHVIAGPMCSFLLAHLGADVIKIESPTGGDVWRSGKRKSGETGTTAAFTALNAGKRSLAIDVRQAAGAAIVRDLARSADVFVENFRPGTVARYGLDFENVKKLRPGIVYCSISGYGQHGPFVSRGAYDNVIQALTGMMMMGGDSQNAPPQKVGFSVVDIGAGILGALSIVAALARQANCKDGQYIDVSMVQASLMLMYSQASHSLTFDEEIPRTGNRGFSGSPGSDTYLCRDGWIAVAANTPSQFRKFVALLGLEDVCSDPCLIDLKAFNAVGGGFVIPVDLDALQARIGAALALRSAIEMEHQLNQLGIPAARVRKLGEFLHEWKASGMGEAFKTYKQDGRDVYTPGPGFFFSDEADWPRQEGPSLGQDSHALLSSLGVSQDTIEEFVRSGVLSGVVAEKEL